METNNKVATANNQVAEKKAYKSNLVKATETYTSMMINQFQSLNLKMDDYQKVCLANAVAKMNELLMNNGMQFNELNQNNLTSILQQVAMLKVNAFATPRECYFQLRNDTTTNLKTLELGIEGNGNDAVLRTYGVNVDKVLSPIIIREGDEYTYPYFDGEKMQPFTWKPKTFHSKAIAVVYIIIKTDGSRDYIISERENVAANLKAHINNNMMGVDFKEKNRILSKIQDMTLDELLADTELQGQVAKKTSGYATLISPAWKSAQSREQMIIRKMRNNAVKQYPKDFSKAFAILDEPLEEAERVVNNSISDEADFIVAEVNENPNTTYVNQTQIEQFQEEQSASIKVNTETGEVKESNKEPVKEEQQNLFDKYLDNEDWMK